MLKIRNNIGSRPVTAKHRLIISASFLLIALMAGFAVSAIVYQTNRERIQSSDLLGRIFCGEGQHVGDAPSPRGKGPRLLCRDKNGAEVSARNNFVAINMALPFILLIGFPLQYLAWTGKFEVSRRKRMSREGAKSQRDMPILPWRKPR